jgi:hypothetical protein
LTDDRLGKWLGAHKIDPVDVAFSELGFDVSRLWGWHSAIFQPAVPHDDAFAAHLNDCGLLRDLDAAEAVMRAADAADSHGPFSVIRVLA